MNDNGSAAVVWVEDDPALLSAVIYSPYTGWGPTTDTSMSTTNITMGGYSAYSYQRIAMDSNGDAIAIWFYTDQFLTTRTYFSKYTPGAGLFIAITNRYTL